MESKLMLLLKVRKINSDLEDIKTMRQLLLILRQYHFGFPIHKEFDQAIVH